MTRRRPTRLRRAAKWIGVFLSAVLAVALLVSLFRTAPFNRLVAGGAWRSQLGNGAFVIVQMGKPSPRVHDTYYVSVHGPPFYPIYQTSTSGVFKSVIIIPMWLPVFLAFVVTTALWRLDRRFPKGRCQACGYDLSGADHDKCPECGTFLPSPKQVVGRIGRVIATVSPDGGRVAIDRHVWQARPAAGDMVIDKGARVIVRAFRQRWLLVSPKSSGPSGHTPRRSLR
ncbi:MAG: NfeD family protein [Planctomycetota bacterium]|nr:NfeD family protein [Planctomycetota bacterium]